jgi:hypothetical protein
MEQPMAEEVDTTELPPEPARRSNTLLIAVVVIGLFLLCCCLLLALFAIGWLWTYGDTLLDISQLMAQFAA